MISTTAQDCAVTDASADRNNEGRLRDGMMTENRVMEQQPVLASKIAAA
jgi:hypothetical protein